MKLRLLFFLLLSGCATYQSKLVQPMRYLQNGQADQAALLLKKSAFEESDDQLVYLLDYGLIEQIAGNYKASNKAFLAAADVADLKDYHSISRIAGSFILNEGMVQYKGDEYEKLLIHVYAAINFLLKKNYEAARVEVRRIHDRVNKLELEGKKFFTENPFAFYISALIWEQSGNLDSAYIDYKNTYKYAPHFLQVKEDLLRLSYLLGRNSDYANYKKDFTEIQRKESEWKNKSLGELVVIYQQGRGPQKAPHPNASNLPILYPVRTKGVGAKVTINGTQYVGETSTLLDLETLAITSLDKQYASLVAKRIAGLAAKAVVAKQVSDKDQTLGQLAWIAMNLSDRADLRQWVTLPQTLQVLRLRLPKGTHKVRVAALTSGGAESGEVIEVEVEIVARQKAFLNWRSFQ